MHHTKHFQKERKLKVKPSITKSILQSIKVKNKYNNTSKNKTHFGINDISFIGVKPGC